LAILSIVKLLSLLFLLLNEPNLKKSLNLRTESSSDISTAISSAQALVALTPFLIGQCPEIDPSPSNTPAR
jgi:hypothetical protein